MEGQPRKSVSICYCFCQASSYSTCSIQTLQALLGCVLHWAADSCDENSRRSKSSQHIHIHHTFIFIFPCKFKLAFFFQCDSNTSLRRSFRGRIFSLLSWLETSVKLQTRLCFKTQLTHKMHCVDVLHKAVASSFTVLQWVTHWSNATRYVFLRWLSYCWQRQWHCSTLRSRVLIFTLWLIKSSSTLLESLPLTLMVSGANLHAA